MDVFETQGLGKNPPRTKKKPVEKGVMERIEESEAGGPRMGAIQVYQKPSFQRGKFCCGLMVIDFSRKKVMTELLEVFFKAPRQQINKTQLVRGLYSLRCRENPSKRMLECLNHNGVKMMSRCRRELNRVFKESYPNYHWFVHDPLTESWTLLRIYDHKNNQPH